MSARELRIVLVAVMTGMFLGAIDGTIVTTALADDRRRSGWAVAGPVDRYRLLARPDDRHPHHREAVRHLRPQDHLPDRDRRLPAHLAPVRRRSVDGATGGVPVPAGPVGGRSARPALRHHGRPDVAHRTGPEPGLRGGDVPGRRAGRSAARRVHRRRRLVAVDLPHQHPRGRSGTRRRAEAPPHPPQAHPCGDRRSRSHRAHDRHRPAGDRPAVGGGGAGVDVGHHRHPVRNRRRCGGCVRVRGVPCHRADPAVVAVLQPDRAHDADRRLRLRGGRVRPQRLFTRVHAARARGERYRVRPVVDPEHGDGDVRVDHVGSPDRPVRQLPAVPDPRLRLHAHGGGAARHHGRPHVGPRHRRPLRPDRARDGPDRPQHEPDRAERRALPGSGRSHRRPHVHPVARWGARLGGPRSGVQEPARRPHPAVRGRRDGEHDRVGPSGGPPRRDPGVGRAGPFADPPGLRRFDDHDVHVGHPGPGHRGRGVRHGAGHPTAGRSVALRTGCYWPLAGGRSTSAVSFFGASTQKLSVTSSRTSSQSVWASSTRPMASRPHPSTTNGGPAWRSISNSSPADRKASTTAWASPVSTPRTWAKVRLRTIHRVPFHARSS